MWTDGLAILIPVNSVNGPVSDLRDACGASSFKRPVAKAVAVIFSIPSTTESYFESGPAWAGADDVHPVPLGGTLDGV